MSATLRNIIAPTPATTRGKSVVVNGDPKGINVLYASGNGIVIRNMKDPLVADIYYEHPAQTTVAKYAPSGFYIASGDVQGNLRIWDTTQKEHLPKIVIKAISGPINDIAWTSDSQRLVVVGDGKEKFGVALLWDSGSTCGEITGSSKQILSCDVKSTRPIRAVTGSEDFSVNWFEAVPFKFKKEMSNKEFTRFVNCVRFSPNGEKVVCVSSDKKGIVYDGKDGNKLIELESSHTGGIYSCSWSEDNNRILTASADKTCKIWDSTTGKCEKTFTFGSDTNDQQLGCLWQGDSLISVNLNGDMTYLDINNPSQPLKVVKGHNKLVSAISYDKTTKTLFSAACDSTFALLQWDLTTGVATNFSGPAHKNQITHIKVNGDQLITCAMDDSVKISSISKKTFGESIAIDSPAQGVAFSGETVVAVSMKSIYVIKGGKVVSTTPAPYESSAVAINGNEVAVGGKDNKIHIYNLNGNNLTAAHTLDNHRGAITDLSYSPNGKLASSCSNRQVIVWDGKSPLTTGWVNHSAKVNALSWTSDSKYVASGALDSQIYIWNVEKPNSSPIQIKNSHLGGVNDVVFVEDNLIASAGNDGAIKFFNITY
ncbi:hypothetical protein DICPUDRAFT_51240 [Dictyostelium purpureum]|uniref:Uncharacterized protein n=1 Tax=Dictyostelium purpureum TaxID=5786 RepID=F1A2T1_DICPU|nr:uncharacterized protein DICPUDRAFT_51240 [Dictyostelium purpureum]EGC29501.1 hypothetical protein DICPUDRAFT_51240 [Dictyostelium purpureum]|eukprot:XP_003293976.1 hypothetical protein DICPUDRAFT_51240 [Dictyostelium purpureum]